MMHQTSPTSFKKVIFNRVCLDKSLYEKRIRSKTEVSFF